MLRLFVAVEIPPEVKKEVAALCQDVRNARWVNPRQLHVTLHFLGENPDERLPALRGQLAGLQMPAFRLSLRGAGVFPGGESRKPPRVLWLGLEPAAPLMRLKEAVATALGQGVDAKSKEFSPHLTLARFPQAPDASLADFLHRHQDFYTAEWPVTHVSLFKSTLHSTGAVHELVAAYALGIACKPTSV